ncbi:MAG TPA: DsbA family protein [Phnomibacter sp.]|nr:DsbA family protein [Phnomibacter sp.]
MKPLLIYCYDAYCGWCYGFSPVMKKAFENYKEALDFEVLSGGMIPAENAAPISRMAPYIAEHYKNVEALTGVKFGEDYLWHIFNPDLSDWFPASEKPAIALSVFKEYYPNDAVLFATDLQYALHFEGRDLCDNEAYRHLLEQYKIDADEFYTKLASDEYKQKAQYDFALCRQLRVTGFPAAFIQATDNKFYQIARGYTSYEEFSTSIEKVLAELATTA